MLCICTVQYQVDFWQHADAETTGNVLFCNYENKKGERSVECDCDVLDLEEDDR